MANEWNLVVKAFGKDGPRCLVVGRIKGVFGMCGSLPKAKAK